MRMQVGPTNTEPDSIVALGATHRLEAWFVWMSHWGARTTVVFLQTPNTDVQAACDALGFESSCGEEQSTCRENVWLEIPICGHTSPTPRARDVAGPR